jgi:hypothetical protein
MQLSYIQTEEGLDEALAYSQKLTKIRLKREKWFLGDFATIRLRNNNCIGISCCSTCDVFFN